MAIATNFPARSTSEPRVTSGTINWDLTPDVQKDLTVPQRIHELDPAVQGAPILGFQSQVGGPKTVKNVIFYMLRTKRLRDYIAASASFTAAATSISFAAADTALLQAGYHIINLDTREIMEISAVASTSVTAVRSVGTVAAAASDGSADQFMILGYVGAEGDSKFFDLARFPEVIFNYVSELQDTFSITQFAHAGGMMPGALTPQAKERKDRLQRMRMTLEKQSIMSQRAKFQRGTDGKTKYTPDGLDAWCTENEQDFGGDITQATLETWAENLFRYGGMSRIVMCSPKFLRKVNLALSGTQRQNTDVLRKQGLRITTYESCGGTMRFVKHPLFQDDSSTSSDALNGHAYAYPPDDFSFVTINSSITGWFKWKMNVQTPGDRKIQDQLYCNWGCMMTMPEQYGRAFNVGS